MASAMCSYPTLSDFESRWPKLMYESARKSQLHCLEGGCDHQKHIIYVKSAAILSRTCVSMDSRRRRRRHPCIHHQIEEEEEEWEEEIRLNLSP